MLRARLCHLIFYRQARGGLYCRQADGRLPVELCRDHPPCSKEKQDRRCSNQLLPMLFPTLFCLGLRRRLNQHRDWQHNLLFIFLLFIFLFALLFSDLGAIR